MIAGIKTQSQTESIGVAVVATGIVKISAIAFTPSQPPANCLNKYIKPLIRFERPELMCLLTISSTPTLIGYPGIKIKIAESVTSTTLISGKKNLAIPAKIPATKAVDNGSHSALRGLQLPYFNTIKNTTRLKIPERIKSIHEPPISTGNATPTST